MKTLNIIITIIAFICNSSCTSQKVKNMTEIPKDIRNAIQQSVDNDYRNGVVIGLVNHKGFHYYSYGANVKNPIDFDENTVFGIGSLSKVFTVSILSEMHQVGVIDMEQSVNSLLPSNYQLPLVSGSEMKLLHLATHTSGLPKIFTSYNNALGFEENLLQYLSQYTYQDKYGSTYFYSNLGYFTLGYLLEKQTGISLEQLFQDYISSKYGLSATTFDALTVDSIDLALPHSNGKPIVQTELSQFGPFNLAAGGAYSSANDILSFLKANMALLRSKEEGDFLSIDAMREPFIEISNKETRTLGWHVYASNNGEIVNHSGQTEGYQCFAGFNVEDGVGVVILANSRSEDPLDRLALHLLDPSIPLPDYSQPKPKLVAPSILQQYIGLYRVTEDDGNVIEITLEDGSLKYKESLEASGKLITQQRLIPMSESKFRLSKLAVEIEFRKDNAEIFRIELVIKAKEELRFTAIKID